MPLPKRSPRRLVRPAAVGAAVAMLVASCGSGAGDAALTGNAADLADNGQIAAAAQDAAALSTTTTAVVTSATEAPLTLPAPADPGESDRIAAADGQPEEPSTTTPTVDPGPTATSAQSVTTVTSTVTTAPSSTAAPSTTTTAAPTTSSGPSVFPDLSVVRVADRAQTTLSGQLAGGDRPVLLWFWTPF